jgi:cholesterol oxidase
MSLWPNNGEQDRRPPLGSAYVRLAPIAPKYPAVPPNAPARLGYGAVPLGMPTGMSDSGAA